MRGYAVVDVETTGLRPAWHDRVIEVGIVQLDAAGAVTGEWGSLVNPARDLGPQRIHRITAADVRHAPDFAAVAGTIADLLRERVVVAHNLAFDAMFLAAEFRRAGYVVPLDPETGVCTMRWAPHFLPDAPRNLAGCCALAEVPLSGHHDALVDARAAAGLLTHYLGIAGGEPPWRTAGPDWPRIDGARVAAVRRGVSAERDGHFLARIVDRMPRVSEPAAADDYLALLDRVLLDGQISASAGDALVEFATAVGLGRADLDRLHRDYLAALVRAASDEEGQPDGLDEVAALLGLPAEAAHTGTPRQVRRTRIQHGDLVAFTGETREDRTVWEQRAAAAGFVPHPRVTRQVALLVAADPDTMSQKARQARAYGIPIVTIGTFRKLVGQ